MSDFDESNIEQSANNWSAGSDDNRSVAGRARVRAKLQSDVEAFLSGGGKIEEVDTHFRSDAPLKVDVGLGSQTL